MVILDGLESFLGPLGPIFGRLGGILAGLGASCGGLGAAGGTKNIDFHDFCFAPWRLMHMHMPRILSTFWVP